ncbi:MAG TPA: hypothetical protein VLX12_11775 [Syntrophorhabdales bacterium]|nr:hypothetical protein [Syntrophorhabdales bacterium]
MECGISSAVMPIHIQADDPAFGRVPRAAARSPTRKRVPGCTQKYVEESDAVTTKVYT